jgi:DNA-binding CsgD family transcriptional regulator
MMGVFAGTLSCLLLLILRQRVQVSRLRREVAKSGLVFKPENYQAIQVIRDAITQGKNINTALIHLSNLNDLLTHGIPPKALSDIDNPLLKTLNRRELQLLEQIQRGYSSKEISIILNISPGHVYNMRSIIREKLGLDREMDLEEWLKNLFSESQETMVRERKREKESKEVS